ncbi:GNAT family N-acetyltransferase [Xylocopilactobacillus apis]|uniref:N-acetyltransferase n=1 Tax=Xylocopilactobacillus apis TaxID=2932183 RepID=A0AAU9CXZ9_9LACO|nr:GNAT family N-acetyltransferase [Xylocopilactobacillus apis]BDR57306.1 N-acetyltransferase [Xylocopilactobacillus apis]
MEIQSEPGRFFIDDPAGKMLAEIKYISTQNGKVLDIVRTFVDESLRGQGVASVLLERVVKLARDTNAKIIPTCNFAKLAFESSSEYRKLQYEQPKGEV